MTDLRKAAEEALEILECMGHRNSDAAQHLRAALRREALNEVHQMDHQYARRDAIELADALDRCVDELLIFGNDFSKPLTEAASELRRLHAALKRANGENQP